MLRAARQLINTQPRIASMHIQKIATTMTRQNGIVVPQRGMAALCGFAGAHGCSSYCSASAARRRLALLVLLPRRGPWHGGVWRSCGVFVVYRGAVVLVIAQGSQGLGGTKAWPAHTCLGRRRALPDC